METWVFTLYCLGFFLLGVIGGVSFTLLLFLKDVDFDEND